MIVLKNIILGSYFTTKKDPQRKIYVVKDSFEYIANWYTSIMRLNLNAILFYDNLSDWFIKKFENQNIRFVKVNSLKYGICEGRFLIYLKYLNNKKYDYVFLTDVQDLWFAKDPFKIITPEYKIYVGVEDSINKDNLWMIKRYLLTYKMIPNCVANKSVLNCGIFGGAHIEVQKILTKFKKEYLKNSNKRIKVPLDMVIFNKLIYEQYLDSEIYFGKKLQSPYKLYLKSGNFAIFHK